MFDYALNDHVVEHHYLTYLPTNNKRLAAWLSVNTDVY
jgi:hypothetical protein